MTVLEFVFRKLSSVSLCHWKRKRSFDTESFLQLDYVVNFVHQLLNFCILLGTKNVLNVIIGRTEDNLEWNSYIGFL